MLAGNAALHHPAKAFTSVRVDNRDDRDRPPIGSHSELEVHRPHPVGRIGGHSWWCGGGAVAFAASPLRHPQSLFAPEPLNLLVIHDPPFRARIVIGGPDSTARMIPGVVAKPGPQRRIRVLRG